MLEIPPTHNQPAYSVTEISGDLKRLIEDQFGHVRVRGEISGWKLAASGHAYLKLKDAVSVLDAVCWKGTVSKLPMRPEDGLEIIATGRITTYPGRSTYQLVIERMEHAGAGALMALLEKRKRQLAEEGLFAPERKRPLPFLPRVIGVVTSPTGAVIRDILHRLEERFPSHLLLWPVLVQGEGAAMQIARAIEGFNALDAQSEKNGGPPRPDLLIVARGGGSLEDLWPFNEEIVVRAAAASRIPLISAVGHETDTTLIDYAADHRAPTPTAAAERAVPVREEWLYSVMESQQRLFGAAQRLLGLRQERLVGLARGLLSPARLVEMSEQRLDDWNDRLRLTMETLMQRKEELFRLAAVKARPHRLHSMLQDAEHAVERRCTRLVPLLPRLLNDLGARLDQVASLAQSLNPLGVLARGFALVRDGRGKLVTQAQALRQEEELTLIFADGERKGRFTPAS